MKTKIAVIFSILTTTFLSLWAEKGPQDNWYLDREINLPEMPGFQHPSSVEIGPSGISYVVDRNTHTITLWDQNGSFITRMSKYGSGAGQLHRPEDIAVSQKEIYVVNYDGHRVEVFDLNGTFIRSWGKHGSNDGEFYHPSSIALDMNGSNVYEVFIADRYHHEIEVFDSNGTYKRKIGENGNGDHQLNEPTGVQIGPDSLLYVSSQNHNKIKVFDTNGSYLRSFSTSSNPFDISFHGDKLAVSLYDNHKVQIFDKNGSGISTIGTGSNSQIQGEFYHPNGLSYHPNGELHVADSHNHRIQVFDSNNSYVRSYGMYGQAGVAPYSFQITPENTFLISDVETHRVFEIDENGSLIRMIANHQGNMLGFGINNPRSAYLAADNRVYIADTSHNRIQIYERNGTFVRKFGTYGSGDGQFSSPYAVIVSPELEVFVADYNNHRVQVFDTNGTFLRKFGSNGTLEGQMRNVYNIAFSDQGNIMVGDWNNRRIIHFSKAGEFIRHSSTNEHPRFIKDLPHGLTAVSRDSRIEVYDANGDWLKRWYKPGGSSSAFDSYPDGTIAWLDYNHDKILFYKPTYRTVRPAQSNEIPLPKVLSVVQPDNSNNLQITFRIDDSDSSQVTAKMIAFIDGGNDLSKVIVPSTFIGSTAGKLDNNVATNQDHNITWNVGADWSVGFGELEVAIMAKDERNLLNLHFLTLPGTDDNATELKINRAPITDADLLELWYWLLASGDAGVEKQGGSILPVITGPGPSFQPSDLNNIILWVDSTNVDGDGNHGNEPIGGKVQTWVNLSDTNNNFEQANESKRPTLVSNVLNGKPGLFFDNDSDGMASTVQISSTPYTVVALFNTLSFDYNSRRAIQGSRNWLIGPYSRQIGFHTDNGWVSNVESVVAEKFYLCVASADDSSSSFLVNGKDLTQYSNSRYHPDFLHLGGSGGHSSQYLNGYICEVHAYSRKLNASEISDISSYFEYKWKVGASLADGTTTTTKGRQYLFDMMNLREASPEEVTRAKNGAVSGTTNQFTPTLQVGPGDRPNKVNEYGFDTGSVQGAWVTPK